MTTVESKTPWSIQGVGVAEQESLATNLLSLVVLFTLFYISAYWSVSSHWPASVPVHHDDYSNYAAGSNIFQWTWIRPLSTALIFMLSKIGPDWLIWTVRCLTVTFAFLVWKILTLVQRPSNYHLILVLYGIAVFSNPIIVEYARYTGMITHLLSGCLGSMAVIYLFRAAFLEYERGYIFSVVFFLMSVLAKEDFVILYAVSMLVAALAKPGQWQKTLAWSGTGLAVGFAMIAGAKFFSHSSFLGVTDKTASYYLDWSLISLLKTTFVYLSSAGHPSLAAHGSVVLIIFFALTMVALAIFFRYKRFSTVHGFSTEEIWC
jgi:hypothetical protein